MNDGEKNDEKYSADRRQCGQVQTGRVRVHGPGHEDHRSRRPGQAIRLSDLGVSRQASVSPRRYSLGPVGLKTVEDARRECLELQLREQTGEASDETVRAAVPKFRDFVEGEWKTARYDHLKPTGRKRIDSALRSRLLPKFGSLPLDRFTRTRVNRWFDSMMPTKACSPSRK